MPNSGYWFLIVHKKAQTYCVVFKKVGQIGCNSSNFAKFIKFARPGKMWGMRDGANLFSPFCCCLYCQVISSIYCSVVNHPSALRCFSSSGAAQHNFVRMATAVMIFRKVLVFFTGRSKTGFQRSVQTAPNCSLLLF